MTRATCRFVAIVLLMTPLGGCAGFRPLPMGAAAPRRTAPGWLPVAGPPSARALPGAAPRGAAQPIGPARVPLPGGGASASPVHIGDTVVCRPARAGGDDDGAGHRARGAGGTRGEYVPWITIVSVTVLSSDTYRVRLRVYCAIIAVQALVYMHHGG